MPVPLTARSQLTLAHGTCDKCGLRETEILCIEVHVGTAHDSAPVVCLDCMRRVGKVEEILVFNEPQYNVGRRPPTKTMQRTARRREEQLAEDIGGQKQPASGSLPHAKGDVRKIGQWLGDDKTCRTTKKGFRLTRELVSKVRSWCKRGEKFFITIGFLHPITQRVEDEVVVIDRHVFEEIVHARLDQ